jgi:sugar lactone lactonase YvrE
MKLNLSHRLLQQLIVIVLFIFPCISMAQPVGFGTRNPHPSAVLEISGTQGGMLFPRMNINQRNNINQPAVGLMLFCTNCGPNGEMQVYNGHAWTNMIGGPASGIYLRPLQPFSANVSNRTFTQADVSWTPALNTFNSDTVFYKIILNGVMLFDRLTSTRQTLTNLNAGSIYRGQVQAYTLQGDTSAASFTIDLYNQSNYSYLNGYYRVIETSKVLSSGATSNYTFVGQIAQINDSVIQFIQTKRVPQTWWTVNFNTNIYPALQDSLIGTGITPRGRILSNELVRVGYLFGSTLVYDVKQRWEKLSNPADTSTITYSYPNVPNMITTVAGSNTSGSGSGSSGDGGPANLAKLLNPYDVVVNAQGTVFFNDGGFNYSIRMVTTDGIIQRFAGNNTSGFSGDGGLAINAQLNFPQGLAIDKFGNVYIADGGNRIIRKVNTQGIIQTIAGIPGSFGYSGDGGQATAAQLAAPNGMAFDAAGNLFFADAGRHVIRKIDTAGIITTVAGTGTSGFSGDGGPATAARLYSPTDICFDNNGNMIIADRDNHAIRRINPSGIIERIAGIGGFLNYGFTGDGGVATAAKLNKPQSVSTDSLGNVYFSDYTNNRIRKINTNGIIQTVGGNGLSSTLGDGPNFYGGDYGTATNASISAPYGIFWWNNQLFIASSYRIRKIRL